MGIDIWQVVGSTAAIIFSVGFVDQLRLTLKTRDVDGLSILQWSIFALASGMFAAYYAHLEQWMMVLVSVFGTTCCLLIVGLIIRYKKH
ncbi:MAG: hypothetical protein R8M46_08655 [Ghiorsea sp.]